MTMRAAIIVPAIEVGPLLERCVKECARTAPDAEIIALVDSAEGADVLDGLATVVETGPVTIGAKRNLGASMTTAAALAFIDSDAYPDDGWLQHALRELDADAALGAVGGPNISPPVETREERWVGLAHNSALVAGWWKYRRDRHAATREVGALPSCNLIVRHDAYDSVGGMNEHLFTAEDTDFCRRFVGAGHRIRFTSSVVVFHKNRDLRSFVVQRYTFGVAMVPLLRDGKAPDLGYTAASFALALFALALASGPLAVLRPATRRAWLATVAAYAALLAAEAVRLTDDRRDAPGTAAALAIGNLAPGVGFVAKALGLSPDLRGVYRNDR